MNCTEKRHASHKASMQQHLRYLDSFMDETDREVMSLTDRAFKSLCIGDEAIYNDSEFSPPLVSCHKPLAEEVAKKAQDTCSMAVKKHETHPLNGVKDMPWQMNKNSSLFAAYAAKKNGDTTMINGDSWDKSALLSIQRELTEFSSDYHNNIADKHSSWVKNHFKSSEKSHNNSSKDSSGHSGKSSKNKSSKSNKIKKLNSKNFFLHSELSPFQSWRDLNKLPFGLENIEIFQSNGPPEWYDSPTYKKLTMSHSLQVPESNKGAGRQNTSLPALEMKPEPEISQHTANTLTSIPLKTEKHPESEIHTETQPQVLPTSSGSQQRSQSEGDHSAPWRKSRSRAKSAVPVGQPLTSPLTCEKTATIDEGAQPIKKEVRTMEEQGSASSTPFNILQLLTPVIPSRQGTGSSEVHRAFLSPSTLDLPLLPEREKHPSPEIKREGYKSIASSLLFNLKDNRKRVKAMYSPPKFKGLDPADQNKLSPLIEQVPTKEQGQEVAEIPNSKITSPVHQKAHKPPVTPSQQISTPSGLVNGGFPDDYLALSLLQAGNTGSPNKPLKSSKSSSKATYPSLNLYRKTSPGESEAKNAQISPSIPGSHPSTDKTTKQVQDGKDLQRKLTPTMHQDKPTDRTGGESTRMNNDPTKGTSGNGQTEIADTVTLKEKYPLAFLKNPNTKPDALTSTGSRNPDKANMGDREKVEQRPAKDKERMETKPKHSFSARQNNYIKSQRYASVGDKDYGYIGEEVAKDKSDEGSRMSESVNVSEGKKGKENVGVSKVKEVVDGKLTGAAVTESVKNDASVIKDYSGPSKNKDDIGDSDEQRVNKGDSFSMKGNTSAKRALFTSKEQTVVKAPVPPKKENLVMDKFELAKAALEEVIAERNQRKMQAQTLSGGQELGMQEDYKQVNMLASGQQKDVLEGATKDKRKGRKGSSDFTSCGQNVQSMSETKNGESHMAEVNLARPSKQEGAAEHGQLAAGQIKYMERDRSGRHERQRETDNVRALDKVTERKHREHVPKNISLMKENSRVSTAESRLTRQGDDSAAQKKSGSFKPEVPPRRGRAGSQTEERLVYEIYGMEDRERADKLERDEQAGSSEGMNVKPNLQKERGPVRGHVSALKEKFNNEQGGKSASIHNCSHEESPKDSPKKSKDTGQRVMVSTPAAGTASAKQNHEGTGVNSDEEPDKNSLKLPMRQVEESARERPDAQDPESINRSEHLTLEKEDKRVIKESPCAFEALEVWDNQNKSKDWSKNSVKEIMSDLLAKSNAEKVKSGSEPLNEIRAKTPEVSESVRTDDAPIDSIIVYDILKQPKSLSPVEVTEFDQHATSPKGESQAQPESNLPSPTRKCDEKLEKKCEPSLPSPPSDMEKGGWVRCLMDSARNLTPTSRSNTSTPTMGKPALFKVKDNTFSVSPVTKTVRPFLHKTLSEISQLWSPKESLSGSERGEEDIFKDCVEVQSPTILSPTQPSTPAAQSPLADRSSVHLLSPLASQFTSGDRKGQLDCLTVPEEDGTRSGVSSVSEGIESCEMSGGDTVDEMMFGTMPTEDAEESKATSERSGSTCSGLENQSQFKPPAVPPKTEKALRRAMKLTTRRIQKAESKNKSERKGRSSEKNTSHKPERRHHSSDKVLSSRSEHRTHSINLGSTHQSTGEDDNDSLLLKTHRRERLAGAHRNQDEKQLESHANQNCNLPEAKSSTHPRQTEEESHFEGRRADAQSERTGRTSAKYVPEKLDRRAQSLDRFSANKSDVPKRLPLRQNSIERSYASNIVTQSFPLTQRKLLQDPDSGQYFVVDMPVQVKTKTFFDPETGSYVQLPVQSPDASVPQAQSMEVMKAPPLVLYHGFVPMPVTTLPAQTSTVRLGSVVTPDDLEGFESYERERHNDRPGHVEVDVDGVR